MKRVLSLSAVALALQGCLYGVVNDANTGSGINLATVKVIKGNCSGAGCTGSPVSETTASNGLYIFDAYGDQSGAADVKIITVASGEEAVELRVEKSGYTSRTVWHKPKYKEATNNGKTYQISEIGQVYLCPIGALDSDGDTICDAAEARYQTNPNNSDTDGDSLSDAAELFGSNGVDLRYFGATPRKKDVFIEADYYPNLKPLDNAVSRVVQAFADAPVSNPDGTTGIALHIDVNQQIAAADVDSDLSPVWTDFDVIKTKYFHNRRAKLFHYVLFANQYDGGSSSGKSRGIPAHDFIVTLGNWSTPGGTEQQQAGTLMHEFGHNLGLMHGGNENENYKPNYLSLMSYSYQLGGLTYDGTAGKLDYSRVKIASVNESSLSETNGFAAVAPTTEADLAHYRPKKCNTFMTGTASNNVDFDGDGVIEASVATSLNCDTDSSDIFSASQNDWSALVFHGGGTIGDDALGINEKAGVQAFMLSKAIPEYMVEQCITEYEHLRR